MYRDLCAATGVEQYASVHLAHFPVTDESLRNLSLEDQMGKARTFSLALSLRKKEQIKVSTPPKIMIPVRNAEEKEALKR